MAIVCKSQAEIEKMRRSGHIVRQVLDELRKVVAPGVTTMDLPRLKNWEQSRLSRDITVIPACCALR
jgi:methionine aminopeptidase